MTITGLRFGDGQGDLFELEREKIRPNSLASQIK